MKKLIGLAVVVAAVFLMVLTCPDKAQHKEAVMTQVNLAVGQEIDKNLADEEDGARMLGKLFVGGIAGMMADNMLTVDNYFVCSIGTVEWQGERRKVSFGILGHVFTVDSEHLKQAAKHSGS